MTDLRKLLNLNIYIIKLFLMLSMKP